MKIRSLDIDGDWNYGKGFSSLSQNSNAIKLNIVTKLREWKRDCFNGLNQGINWASRVGSNQETLLKSDIQSLVQSLFGIQDTFNYYANYNSETRNLYISFSYIDIYNNNVDIEFNPLA